VIREIPIICETDVLTVREAKKLVTGNNQFFRYFAKLNSMSVEVATELAKFKGCLCFKRLVDDLHPEVAAALAKHRGGVFLGGLTRLLPETAAELAQYQGKELHIDDVTSLTDEAVSELGNYFGTDDVSLSLRSMRRLSDKAAVGLAKKLLWNTSSLYLDGLTSLTTKAAQELVKCRGILSLKMLRRPSKRVLAILELSPAIGVVLNPKFKLSRKRISGPVDYVKQLCGSFKKNMCVVDGIKRNSQIMNWVSLCGIERLPEDVSAMYFAHVFGDHTL
jgi:hypothetical protein